MKVFLITLVATTVGSIAFWQLGLAFKIWPNHPFLATVVFVAGFGIILQLILSGDAVAMKTK